MSALEARTGVIADTPLFPPPPNSTVMSGDDPLWSTFRLIKTNGTTPIESVLTEYRNSPGIESATFDRYLTIQAEPNDPKYSQLWGMKKIQAPQAWDTTTGSSSVTVAVLDTGADYNQADLKDTLLPGANFVNQGGTTQDDHGHGTHVSGTIGAMGNNGIGVAGINWTVKVLPVKVLNSQGSGTLSQIANGMKYVADNAEAQHVKAINMSLGGRGTSLDCQGTFNPIITELKQKGVLVVAAAGNDNANASSYVPASCADVLTVGATDQNDSKASFSNFGATVELSAPGTTIYSTCRGGSFCQMSGTSMASPHVAGAVGLMYVANPNLTVDQAMSILSSSANLDPLTSPASTPIGAGRLNLAKALSAATNGQPQPTITVSPTTPVTTTQPNPTQSQTGSPTSPPSISPTKVPLPIPDPPAYTCAPLPLPTVTQETGCTCTSGACTSACKFSPALTGAPPIPREPDNSFTPAPTGTVCKNLYGECRSESNCQSRNGTIVRKGCGNGQICCISHPDTPTPTPAEGSDNNSADGIAIAAAISCKNSLNQDVPEYCTRKYRTIGDVDGNDIVNMTDYLLALRVKTKAPVPNTANADVDGNGIVDDKDLGIIKQTLRSLCY